MKQFLSLVAVILFGCAGCVAPRHVTRENAEFTAKVDQLCAWTGLERVGRVKSVEGWSAEHRAVEVDLSADHVTHRYVIVFDAGYDLYQFRRKNSNLGDLAQGLGYDNVRDTRQRAICIAAVERFCRHLPWKRYGRPALQVDGHDFLVTYETVSEAQQKKANYGYLDPYVSFRVTPGGIVVAVIWGA